MEDASGEEGWKEGAAAGGILMVTHNSEGFGKSKRGNNGGGFDDGRGEVAKRSRK